MTKPKINTGSYILIATITIIASWLLHELAHYAMGIYLGYDMRMTLNTASPTSGSFRSVQDANLISAAGPIFTLLVAVITFYLMRRRQRMLLYPLLFTCFYMRLLAACLSIINPNDEARVSQSLGLGTFTIPMLVVAILFYFLYNISSRYNISKKQIGLTFLLIMFFSSVIILSDQFLGIRIL